MLILSYRLKKKKKQQKKKYNWHNRFIIVFSSTICTIKKGFTCHKEPKTCDCLGRMCTPVFHISVIMSAIVSLSLYTFHTRKALLYSQQPMVQNKAAEEQAGPHL